MDDRIEKLQKMQTHHLIEVVKNYRQHGYPLEIRESALSILEERGVSKQTLELSGNMINRKYDEVQDEYKKFHNNSVIALVLYISSVVAANSYPLLSLILSLATLVLVGLSFQNTKKLSQLLNDKTMDYSVLFIFVSVFLYVIMYFVIRRQVKEKIIFIS